MQEEKIIKNKSNRIFQIIFAIVAIAIVLIYTFSRSDENLHVYFLDVGQGDSSYVRYMDKFDLVIDCGPDTKFISQLGQIMPYWDRKIDYLLLSHPHSDHLSGCIELLNRFEIGQIIATDATHTTSEYLEWLKLIREKNIPYKLARAGQEINLDNDIKLGIFWPNESYQDKSVENLNNTSIVAKLVYNHFSVLFAGDAETGVQQNLLKSKSCKLKTDSCDLKADILKVAHHGSNNGADINFLKAVSPEIAIISVGQDNKFGHPAPDTLKKIDSLNAKIYRTDQNSTIEIISDGNTYWTKTSK